ncbi:hypothetical protein [Phocaeicola barnesiae]|uniref:Uncharacterized protein n=1 Tax=Phocaeicola barnesiae TaxID=376804 RepID=A0AAW5N532_9BACT|nr:hypothetical protein [Phocaeicola barnesiae]MCR8874322.1 hypothetical protein [Phocaeicola barnesiae]
MELVKNRLASFAICPLNVKGAVLNARLRIRMMVVLVKLVPSRFVRRKGIDGIHGCTLFLLRFQNSNDLYQ